VEHIADADPVRVFRRIAPAVAWWSLRVVEVRSERLSVRRGVPEPVALGRSRGAMVTLSEGGAPGWAATADLSPSGLRAASERARAWARLGARHGLDGVVPPPGPARHGRYRTAVERPWDSLSGGDRLALVDAAARRLRVDRRIVDWQAVLAWRRVETVIVDAHGSEVEQSIEQIDPHLSALADDGVRSQGRSLGERDCVRQGGLEQLERLGHFERAEHVGREAIELLEAPPCPDGRTDLLLLPGQMILQLHESVGHPLELDRILGDERNYAGGSFVTPGMFGRFRYGSALMNVSFDPDVPGEATSAAFDDEGTPAERHALIRDGLLLRPLGGAGSQARAGLPGVACARACDWTRPAIDRMANLNLEPGAGTLAELVSGIERGVLMDTNRSWSIDHRRDKFQFGCEYARRIEDGRLGRVLRDPGYRGRTVELWHALSAVGGADTRRVLGVKSCGKGEPNQLAVVGHAAPACVFRDVAVFGAA